MSLTGLKNFLLQCGGWLAAHAPTIFFVFAGIMIVYFGIFVVQPFDVKPDEASEDVAGLWNRGIAQFGITPLFPPQEEFYVGDIWVVASETSKSKSIAEVPLLLRAVRLGHIDLNANIFRVKGQIFSDTGKLDKDQEYVSQSRDQVEGDPDDGKFRLSLIAFPRFVFSRVVSKRASLAAKYLSLGSVREETVIDEVKIPTAETYGVTAGPALGALLQWCDDKQHALLCTDNYLRLLLKNAMAGDFPSKDYRVEMRLITRAYLMRRIEQRRLNSSSLGAKGRILSSASDVADANELTEGAETSVLTGSETKDLPAARAKLPSDVTHRDGRANGVSTASGTTTELGLYQTFQRPIVFGFRYVAISPRP